MRLLNQAGDTIVEVIVVLAVLGSAISISYATASRSLTATRQAEENSQATAILQSQIETLRAYAGNDDASSDTYIYKTSSAFCVDLKSGTTTLGKVYELPNIPAAAPASDAALVGTNSKTTVYANYPDGHCQTDNGLFHIAIGYDGASTFTARATWDDAGGQGYDTVRLVYKIHKDNQ